MSNSDNTLTVTAADDMAEIAVMDGSFNVIANGIGKFQQSLPQGIYKIRVRVGPTVEQKLVSLDKNVQLDFPAFRVSIVISGYMVLPLSRSVFVGAALVSGAVTLVLPQEMNIIVEISKIIFFIWGKFNKLIQQILDVFLILKNISKIPNNQGSANLEI